MPGKLLKSSWFCPVLLIILTVPLWSSLCQDHLIRGHDAQAGLIRAICMEKYWGNGQFLVRWSPDVNFGYGSPMFNFYPPFFYYAALLLSKITQNTVLALNWTCLIFWILSAEGMYLFAKEFWGNKGGFLSAIVYVYSPYYVQDFYVRGAFSEFSTFMILPLLLLSIYKLNQKPKTRYVLGGILCACASILIHGMGMFFILIAFFYALSLFILKKNRPAFFLGILALLTGLMISAFYWLPALWETKYLNLNFLISMRYDFHHNFISLGQLFCTPWDRRKDMDGLSLQIGAMPLVLLFLSLFVPFKIFRKNAGLMTHYFFFLLIALTAIVLTLPVSAIFWEHFNILKFIQLPWRFLTIAAFATAFLAGCTVLLFNKQISGVIFLVTVTVLVILSPARFYCSGNFKTVDETAVKSSLSTDVFLGEGERTPKWIKTPPLTAPLQKFQIVQGNGQFSQIKANALDNTAHINAEQPLMACFHTFYFPGWRVFIDNKETQIYPDNIYGLVLFLVPAGEHTVQAVFGPTPVRVAGTCISWVGVLFLIGSILWVKNKNKTIFNPI